MRDNVCIQMHLFKSNSKQNKSEFVMPYYQRYRCINDTVSISVID